MKKMTNETKKARIIEAIRETERDLKEAEKKYGGTLECIAMDERDGYRVTDDWIAWRDKDKKEVDRLKAHIEKLNKMMEAVA